MTGLPALRRPDQRRKCHDSTLIRQGWLTVTTYAVCAEHACVVNGTDDSHCVVLVNDSPLQYYFDVRGRCVTDGIAYLDGNGDQQNEWEPNTVHIDGRRKSRAERTRYLEGQLVALRKRDNETIEVSVSWSCVAYHDSGELSTPLRIQVDAEPTAT